MCNRTANLATRGSITLAVITMLKSHPLTALLSVDAKQELCLRPVTAIDAEMLKNSIDFPKKIAFGIEKMSCGLGR